MSWPLPPLTDRWMVLRGGARIHYWEGGSGPPLVLLHGLGGSTLDWCAAAPLLAASHRVLAPDIPGFGQSDPWPDPSLEAGSQFLSDFIRASAAMDCVLVGNSMGGALALQAAAGLSGSLRAVVLVSSAGLGREIAWRYRLLALPGAGRFARPPSLAQLRQHWRLLVHDVDALPAGFLEARAASLGTPSPMRELFRVGRLGLSLRGQRADYRAQALDLSCPVLVLWGDRDRVIPLRHGAALVEALPQARLHVFEPCGHCAQLEMPEAFSAQVTTFVSESLSSVSP